MVTPGEPPMNGHKQHATTIDREYVKDESVHRWHAACSCGWQGTAHLSPRQAERDAENHAPETR